MSKYNIFYCAIVINFALFSRCCTKTTNAVEPKPLPTPVIITKTDTVMLNGKIQPSARMGMGVNTSNSLTNWIKEDSSYQEFDYPGNLSWGAVFITAGGDPVSPPESDIDMSELSQLSIEMKGAKGGEGVLIGIKDITDPNAGTETRIPVVLTKDWSTYLFKLTDFAPTNLSQIYVVTEFVFPDISNQAETIYVNNIILLK